MDKEQWKAVPLEPTQQMINSASAFCDSRYHLHQIYTHMLESAPQPPGASDERERFEAWATGLDVCIVRDWVDSDRYRLTVTQHLWDSWSARAALAPSPGVDAAEQKPIPLHVIREWPDGLAEIVDATLLDTVGYTLNYRLYDLQQALAKYGFTMTVTEAAPSPAASADEWLAEAVRLAKDLRNKSMAAGWGKTNDEPADDAYAALLAHLKARP